MREQTNDFSTKSSDYFRKRRPENFSDSYIKSTIKIDKGLLEYQLETLGNRSQEKEFENFARRLASQLICPNLIPQTGSTGGGDSKVDSENYPVAEEIAERWYYGKKSVGENWAFAMSVQKTWKAKLKNDLKSIISKPRTYTKVYFISSRFIRDKERAEEEDKWSQEYDIDVRILDRNWLVTSVIENELFEIVATTLDLNMVPKDYKVIGNLDQQKMDYLDQLDQDIRNPDRYGINKSQLVEDCLSSAVTCSHLEKNIHEVRGRFDHAIDLSKKYNLNYLEIRSIYKKAWTECTIYDQYEQFDLLYDIYEDKVKNNYTCFEDIANLCNLFLLYQTQVALDNITNDRRAEKKAELIRLMEKFTHEMSNPNAAFRAKLDILFIKLLSSLWEQSEINKEELFKEMASILSEAKGLLEFPWMKYKDLLFEFSEPFEGMQEFEELLDLLTEIESQRVGESSAGMSYFNRARTKLKNGKDYDAIILLGKAQGKLYKLEDQEIHCETLTYLGLAYSNVGLYWASRIALLAAIWPSKKNLTEGYDSYDASFLACGLLLEIEAKEGKLSRVFLCTILYHQLFDALTEKDEYEEGFNKILLKVDIILLASILQLEFHQYSKLSKYSAIMGHLGYLLSSESVIYLLGHLQEFQKTPLFQEIESEQKLKTYFSDVLSVVEQ